MHIYY